MEVIRRGNARGGQSWPFRRFAGAPAGFAKVSFRAGNKLWLGAPNDTPTRGGIVLDFATRAASANDGKAAIDSTPDVKVEATLPDLEKNTPAKVTVAGFPAIALREGERPDSGRASTGQARVEPGTRRGSWPLHTHTTRVR